MDLEFEGLDELIAEIDKVESLTDDLKDEALIAGGDFLRDKFKAEVYSHGLRPFSGQSPEAITRTDPQGGELFVGTEGGKKQPGYYLYMQEFGFYNVRAKRFIAPKPTFSTIYENNKNAILDEYVKVFQRGMGMR